MDFIPGSLWHSREENGDDWASARPHKRLRTSKSHASILQPVSRLVRSPLETIGTIVESLGFGGEGEDEGIHQKLPAEQQERQLELLRMRGAKEYDEWEKAALELDRLDGVDEWRAVEESDEYNVSLVRTRLKRLEDALKRDDIEDMRFQIRTALTRDLGGMGDVKLYKHSRIGTKALIERYINTAMDVIDAVVDASRDGSEARLDLREMMEQMKQARQAFGRSALLLSGGGTLGMNHIGLVKALYEANLLPRIISGASAGSIVCAVVCTITDEEIPEALQEFCYGDLDVFEKDEEEGQPLIKLRRFLKEGSIYDVANLVRIMKNLVGNTTFQEAYNRTHRILNICVSSAGLYEMPRLLNYVTAPDVMIWSAVAASCAVPFVFTPASLMSKDPKTGEEKPWNDPTNKHIDGSIDNDLPMQRLAEMLNVNHFIVSQVNPHVIPFLAKDEDEIVPDIPGSVGPLATDPGWVQTFAELAKGEALHRMHVLAELGFFPNVMNKLRSVLGQRYSGDITIIPGITYTQFPRILNNPTPDFMEQALLNGQRATWPKLSRIRNHLAVELKLDEAVRKLITRVTFSPSQVDLRMNAFARPSGQTQRGRSRRGSKGSHMSATSTIVPRKLPGRQGAHRPIKSLLDRPTGVLDVSFAGKVPGPSSNDYPSSTDDTLSPLSTSVSPVSHPDDSSDVESETTGLSPPSPPSEPRQLFLSASQPATPSIASKAFLLDSPPTPFHSSPSRNPPSLTMTPTSTTAARPSSPEMRYKKLFHGMRKSLSPIQSQASTPNPEQSSDQAIDTAAAAAALPRKRSMLGLHLDFSKQRRSSTGLPGLVPPKKQ